MVLTKHGKNNDFTFHPEKQWVLLVRPHAETDENDETGKSAACQLVSNFLDPSAGIGRTTRTRTIGQMGPMCFFGSLM